MNKYKISTIISTILLALTFIVLCASAFSSETNFDLFNMNVREGFWKLNLNVDTTTGSTIDRTFSTYGIVSLICILISFLMITIHTLINLKNNYKSKTTNIALYLMMIVCFAVFIVGITAIPNTSATDENQNFSWLFKTKSLQDGAITLTGGAIGCLAALIVAYVCSLGYFAYSLFKKNKTTRKGK